MAKYRPGRLLAGLLWLLLGNLSVVSFVAGCGNAGDTTPSPVVTTIGRSSATSTASAAAVAAGPSVTPLPGAIISTETPAAVPPATDKSPQPTPTAVSETPAFQLFLPSTGAGVPPQPTATFTPLPTPTPTIDFNAVRANLRAGGQDLGFVKVGFHVGPGGNRNGLGTWMNRLDAAGVPFFLKAVDDSGALVEAQNILAQSPVEHILVYRKSGDLYDTPNYDLPPRQAAADHWALHMAVFPPELDKDEVWLETINEVDKSQAAWLGEFALATAELALRDGFRWAAFGWSSGEPEPADWQSPAMIAFLQLAAANPDRLAIALHEYSFLADDIGHEYPFKVGRFQTLFAICDSLGIPRPTVLITEWGWAYQEVPDPDRALADIAWAAELYAPFPEILGAAIWYLGPGFGDIATPTQRLIAPLTEYALGNYFPVPLPPNKAPIVPESYRP